MGTTANSETGFGIWVEAARPRTLLLAFACIGMGGFIAAAAGSFRWHIVLLAMLTATFLQILSNLANDYGDSKHGADSRDRLGPQRAVQSGKISAATMKQAMILFVLLSAISGLLLVWLALGSQALIAVLIFGILGAGAIWAAIAYTASSSPYGYVGLGDLFVLIFFGLAAVGGTYYLQTQTFEWAVILPGLTCGLLAVAVLNVNNIRDIESDRKAGKRSIPVRIGPKMARRYHWFLLGAAWLTALLFVLLDLRSPWQFLFVLVTPLLIRHGMAVERKQTAHELDPLLKQMSLTTLAFVLLFGIGLVIGA